MANNLNTSMLLDFYGTLLTEKQQKICSLYFNDDLSLAEIAQQIGISRQGVRDAVVKGENTVREFEIKLKLAEHYRVLDREFTKIVALSEEIKNYSSKSVYAGEIYRRAEEIIKIAGKITE